MKKLLFIFAILFSLPAVADELQNVILTNGIGEVEVAVDTVTINLGINTRDKSLDKAKLENQKKYEVILATVAKNLALGKDSIKSNFVSINPSYVPCYPTAERPTPKCDQTKIEFYEVNRSLQIKLDNLEKYDEAIAEFSKSASYINTGQYDVTNKTRYKDEARDLAIDAAKSKALKIAKKLEVKLGKPVRFESVDDEVNRQPQMMVAKMANTEMALDGAPPTDTETMGKIKITFNVNIAYRIE